MTTAAVISLPLSSPSLAVGTFQGYLGASVRGYTDNAAVSDQGSGSISGVWVPEWYHLWNDRDDSLNIKLFARYDSLDNERSHVDIREFYWQHVGYDWELTLGINKIFWGVTESQHLVDIINQTDLVEAPDGEEKLGQAMAHLALIKDWGVLDLFLLPGHRPRTFAGNDGRLRSIPLTSPDNELYASSEGKDHLDAAIRWSQTFDDLNIALSWFKGTSRDPDFLLHGSGDYLLPFYSQIDQFGLEAQYIVGDWIWKLEAIYRNPEASAAGNKSFSATTAGFEYTWVGFANNAWDLGLLLEHSQNTRESTSALQNDLFSGMRWSFNDVASSEILFGVNLDLDDSDSHSVFFEASTRIGNATRVLVEGFYFDSSSPSDPLYSFKQDSYIELALEYYY